MWQENGCKVKLRDVAASVSAVSGKQMTPAGATEIMEIIGKDESVTTYPHSD